MTNATNANTAVVSSTDQIPPPAVDGRSLWADARARLLNNKAAVTSMVVLFCLAVAAIIGPWFTGHAYDRQYREYFKTPASMSAYPKLDQVPKHIEDIAAKMRAKVENITVIDGVARVTLTSSRPIDERLLAYFPRSDLFAQPTIHEKLENGAKLVVDAPIVFQHFYFGTEVNGRDLLTRTLWGCRISLSIGLLATFVALLIGVTYGATSGYFGGRVDLVMMRIVDILYSLPFIFFVIMLVVFFGRNFILMFLAVGAVEWLDMARIVRGQTLSIKRQEYVQAAEVLGVSTKGIIKRHVIPNTLGPVIVYMTLLVPKVILLESFLSFLGLGVQEPWTSLGVLIADGASQIQDAQWMLIFPSIFLVVLLFCLNFIGDGLRDALDPKDR